MMFTTQSEECWNSHDGCDKLKCTPDDELVVKYDLEKCRDWIEENNYQRTCLQFPESLLRDSTSIAIHLQKVLNKTVYVLADTSYGSCCVDEVAAQHVDADSIIHFGHACLSPVMKLPVLYVFEKKNLDVRELYETVMTYKKDSSIIIFYDDVYHHLHSELCSVFEGEDNITISRLCLNQEESNDSESVVCGRAYTRNSDQTPTAVYIGDECLTLENLILALPDFKWFLFSKKNELNFQRIKFLMKRSHLVEKTREANVIGILIGTLGIKNYLDAVDRIKKLVKLKGKKCYTLAVGKPNVAKLANFPEIDVFVYIACQENALLKDFKDYYKPIVSLMEVEMALGDRPYSEEYTSDFRELLPGGSLHRKTEPVSDTSEDTSQDLAEKDPGTMIEYAGARFLSSRSWRGLEQKVGETEVCKAVEGRSGIPQSYENEVETMTDS